MPQENPFRLQEAPTRANPFAVSSTVGATEETLQEAVQASVSDESIKLGLDPSTGQIPSEAALEATPVAFAGAPVAGQQLALELEAADVPPIELELADDSTVTETLEDTFLRGPASGIVGALNAASGLINLAADPLNIPSVMQIEQGRTGIEMLTDPTGNVEMLTNAEVEERGLSELELFNRMENALEPQTLGGNITSVLAQIVVSVVGGGAAIGGIRAASGAFSGTRTVAATTIADLVGFSGADPGISTILADNLGVQNEVIRYLGDRSEGDTAGNRLTNALEGFGLGMGVTGLIRFLRYLKGARNAGLGPPGSGGGGTPEDRLNRVQEYIDENQIELQGVLDDLDEIQASPEFIGAASRAPAGSPAARAAEELASPEDLGEIARQAAIGRLRAGIPDDFSSTRPTVNTARLREVLVQQDIRSNFVDEFAGPSPMNHARMNSPEEIQNATRLMHEVVRPQIDELVQSGTRTHQQIRDEVAANLSDVTDIGFDKLLAASARAAATVEEQATILVASKVAIQSIASQATLLARKLSVGQGSDVDRAKLLMLSQQWGDLTANMAAIRTGTARTVSAGRIETGVDFSEEGVNSAIIRDSIARGDVDILAEQIRMLDGNLKGLGRTFKNPPSTLRKFTEYFTNSLLSNPATHILNFAGNTLQTVILPAEKIIGGALSVSRHRDMKEGMLQYWYMKEAMQESGAAIGKSFRMSQGVLDTETKLDELYSKVAITSESDSIWGSGVRAFGNVVRTSTRLLNTGDETFKQINYRSAVKARAHVEGAERFGEDIVARNQYVQQQLDASFDKKTGRGTNLEALAYAREATATTPLTRDRAYVDIAGALQAAVRWAPAFRFAAPFVRTPGNLIRQGNMRTPLLGAIQKELVDDLVAGGTRRSRAIGKQVMGLTIGASAMWATANGRITGSGPTDPEQRQDLLETGWRPSSWVTSPDANGVRRYIEIGRLDPLAQVVTLASDLYTIAPFATDTEMDEAIMAIGIAFARNIANKQYLTGTIAAMEAWTQPDEKFEQWLGTLASGFVPAGARPIADAVGLADDPVIREARTVVERLMAKTPGISKSLEPQRDWLDGQPRMYPEGYLWGNNSLAPFRRSERSTDIVVNELARIPHGFAGPPRKMMGEDLTPQEHDRWEELHGTIELEGLTLVQALEEAMQDPDYDLDRSRGIPDVPGDPDANRRVQIVAPIIQGYRQAAAAQLREESHRNTPEGEESLRDRIENRMRLQGGLISGSADTPAILEELRRAPRCR